MASAETPILHPLEPLYDTETQMRHSSRERTMTEKGREFQLDLREKAFRTKISNWHHLAIKVQGTMVECQDIRVLRQNRQLLLDALEEVRDAHDELTKLLTSDDASGADVKLQQVQEDGRQLMREMSDALRDLEMEKNAVRSRSSSSRCFDRTSQGSRRSRVSHMSHVSKKADLAVEAAALEAELSYLDRETARKRELAAVTADLEKLQAMKKLEVARAKYDAIVKTEAEEDEMSNTRIKDTLASEDKESLVKKYIDTLPNPGAGLIENLPATYPSVPPKMQMRTSGEDIPTDGAAIIATQRTYAVPEDSRPLRDMDPQQRLLLARTTTLRSDAKEFVPASKTEAEVASRSVPITVPGVASSPIHTTGLHQETLSRSPNVTGVSTQAKESVLKGVVPLPTPRQPVPMDTSIISTNNYDGGPTSESQHLLDATKSLVQQVALSRLPAPEPGIFKGEILMYPSWRAAFETLIESRGIPARETIHYLKRYLGGSAKEAVEGFFFINSEDAYHEAMALLEERYGDPFQVACAFRDKLESWPKVPGRDGVALRKFTDFLRQCEKAMSSVTSLTILNDEKENRKILSKLPDWLIARWGRKAKDWKDDHGAFPQFHVFVHFLKRESDIACDPITSLQSFKAPEKTSRGSRKEEGEKQVAVRGKWDKEKTISLATETEQKGQKSSENSSKEYIPKPCILCASIDHQLQKCNQFLSRSLEERKKYVQENRLCYGCLKKGHSYKDCKRKHKCETCNRRHPTSLHQEGLEVKQSSNPNRVEEVSNMSCKVSNSGDGTTMIVPVWLSSTENPTEEVLTYAILDNQSDATFITEDLTRGLKTKDHPVRLSIRTVTSPFPVSEPSRAIQGLTVRGMHLSKTVKLPKTYTRQSIPCETSQIPTAGTAKGWPHLSSLTRVIPDLQDCGIGLLIGTNCPAAGLPREVLVGNDEEPYAVKTDLGWGIISGSTRRSLLCHRIKARECPEITPREVLAVLQSDFSDTQEATSQNVSQEDLLFLDVMKNGITSTESGHLTMPLPFKRESPLLPNNRRLALIRLAHLKKRLRSDPQYYLHYRTFMEDIIQKGEAEEVTGQGEPGRVWYIPHHGVYHPRKPDKLRVVFDASAGYQSTSLNSHLLTGPDLTNKLTGVLCRFRERPVAIMGDIERMFHQFLVAEEHRDFLRFLWWENGELDTNPREYRMKVHLFGASSSPGCANFGMKYLAEENASEFPRAARFMKEDFYVDDGLTSCETEEEAIELVQESQELCKRGRLHLHKFVSNSDKVVNSIEPAERASGIKDVEFSQGRTPIETALGVRWCVSTDMFTFQCQPKEQPPTRRGILSAVASVFDPLGFISPIVLTGKSLLQSLCRSGIGWDDELPEDLRPRWEDWKTDIVKLSRVQVPRCFIPSCFGEVVRTELHHFSDASNHGYGQCSYIRVVGRDRAHCTLVSGKSRVAPLKIVTIPRLELTAALVSVLMGHTLKEELRIPVDREYYWTDSKVVLAYLCNEARRFHVFVANRVQRIRQLTEPEQWLYIPTELNPADHASRGKSVSALLNSNWFRGPDFLYDVSWKPPEKGACELTIGDPEVRKVATLETSTSETPTGIEERLTVCSRWTLAVGAFARLRRFAQGIRSGRPASCEERLMAETFLIKLTQAQAFEEEIQTLRKEHRVKSTCPLYKLDPVIDKQGILRVGGRLGKANTLDQVKHPAILPRKSHVTRLLIQHFHSRSQHQGRGITLNEVRANGYWILGGSKAVQSHIRMCVTCRKHRRPLEEQKMADLPQDRLEPSAPFTYCGIDVFGPIIVKKGRKDFKRYGLIFTCLCCRGIHIEMLDDMTTDCFINALRCFIAIRGAVKLIRCDQGSNFIGARNEFKNSLQELDTERIGVYLAQRQCQFQFNPPSASHAGGIWERQIRTVRSVLNVTLSISPGRLDDASLRTFLYEVMSIVNGRPLEVASLSDPAQEPLTPNHLLQMKTDLALPPPGKFVREDTYLARRWRRVQYLAETFWSRWKKEYLLSLNERQKWNTPRRNLKVGDVVMINDDSTPRMEWPLGVVTDTQPDEDGLVRKARVSVGTRNLDNKGRRKGTLSSLERPVQKLVVLLEAGQHVS